MKRETAQPASFSTLPKFSCQRALSACERKERSSRMKESLVSEALWAARDKERPFRGRTGARQLPECAGRLRDGCSDLLSAPCSAVPHRQPGRRRGGAGCHVRRKLASVSLVSGGCAMRGCECGSVRRWHRLSCKSWLPGVRGARQARPRYFNQVLRRSTWFLAPTAHLHTYTHFLYNPQCCSSLFTLYRLDALHLFTFFQPPFIH